MKRCLSVLAALLVLAQFSFVSAAEKVSVQSLPPVVIKTVPTAGDTNVDPATAQIRVTFSKDMMTGNMWSWVIHTPGSFPEIAGKVRYLADGRTCVLPVRLQPGRRYAIWINSPNYKHSAFRDRRNNPAVPNLLVFETRQ
jgi:RNA polymerase sigma-70 factor (ECF subfamily)